MWKRLCLCVVLSWVALQVTAPLAAQTTRKTTRATNVQAGALVAVDASAATITLKPKSGADVTYRYTEKTQILRGKKTVEIDTFKPGDAVVVRFRRSGVGPASLYDLTDNASWAWLDRLRHETTPVTVKEITDDTLHATEGSDGAEIDYRVTDKTLWAKGGKPAIPADFKPGEVVQVVPRLLPGGNVMAIAVSDAKDSAAKLKERSRFTVTGQLKGVSAEKKAVSLHTVAGDDREIALAEGCVVRQSSKDVPVSALRPGQTVTVHLTRNDEGEQVAKQITIQSKRVPKRPVPKLPSKVPKKP